MDLTPEEEDLIDQQEIEEFHKVAGPVFNMLVDDFFDQRDGEKAGQIPLQKRANYFLDSLPRTEETVNIQA